MLARELRRGFSNGIPLSIGTGASTAYQPVVAQMRMVPDAGGGAIAVGIRVYAQRVTPNGEIAPGWPTNGLQVCPGANGQQLFPKAVTDTAGGAIVTWWDRRNEELYAQRVTDAGTCAWPDSGVLVSGPQVDGFALAADGAGGTFIAWSMWNVNTLQLAVTHLDAQRVVISGWQPLGSTLCPQAVHPIWPSVVADGSGGAIMVWAELRDSPAWSIYAYGVQSNGALTPGWPAAGSLACTAPGARYYQLAVTDGAGGVITGWPDYRSSTGPDLFAQRITAGGTVASGWAASGETVAETSGDQPAYGDQMNEFMLADGSGGAYLAWTDTRNGGLDIYANHLEEDGRLARHWSSDGNPISTAPLQQMYPPIASDGSGGALFGWFDRRNGSDYDVYMSAVASSGFLADGWPASGLPVCTVAGNHLPGGMCEDGAGGAFIAWEDFRRGDSSGDIYVMRVHGDATPVTAVGAASLSGALEIVGVRPNPARGPVTIRFRLASGSPATLQWLDVNGRLALTREIRGLGAGEHALQIDAGRLPLGIYFVRLTEDDRRTTTRIALVR